jgi:hypothetical protein
MLTVRREGRRHHYTVNLEATFKHPTLSGVSLRTVMGDLVEKFAQPSDGRDAQAARA